MKKIYIAIVIIGLLYSCDSDDYDELVQNEKTEEVEELIRIIN